MEVVRYQELKAKVIEVLGKVGLTERGGEINENGFYTQLKEGFYIGHWIHGHVYLAWSFTTEKLNKTHGSLSDEYRAKEKEMLEAVLTAGFHAYAPRHGGHVIVCCEDPNHGRH